MPSECAQHPRTQRNTVGVSASTTEREVIRAAVKMRVDVKGQRNTLDSGPNQMDKTRHPAQFGGNEYHLARKIRDCRNTEGLAMVQIRYRRGFETKNEAFT